MFLGFANYYNKFICNFATKAAPISDLLVKNVAMSAAMKLTHLRNNDETAAAGSQTVNSRSLKLIQLLEMSEIQQELRDLESTIVKGEGRYQEFLTKWGYDREQQKEIERAISGGGVEGVVE